jgi:hypothetical protein
MNPDDIKLDDLSKTFEYFKLSAEIDAIDDVEKLRNIAKSYIKLYMKHQEVVLDLLSVNS